MGWFGSLFGDVIVPPEVIRQLHTQVWVVYNPQVPVIDHVLVVVDSYMHNKAFLCVKIHLPSVIPVHQPLQVGLEASESLLSFIHLVSDQSTSLCRSDWRLLNHYCHLYT